MANEIIGFGDLIPFSKLLWGARKIRQKTCDLKNEKKRRNNHKISVDITCVIYKYDFFWSKIIIKFFWRVQITLVAIWMNVQKLHMT